MTIEMKKVWFDGEKVVTQNILESDIYKRHWDIASCKAYAEQLRDKNRANTAEHAAEAIEYLLALAQPEQDNTYGYASRLATAIWQKHYMEESPKFALLDTTEGVLTQIDNMTCGLVKEKPSQTEQEPVAWGVFDDNLHDMFFAKEEAQEMVRLKGDGSTVKPLYTTPPQRKPLTDEEAEGVALDVMGFAVLEKEQAETALMLIRATEVAHNIKE